MKMKKNKIGWFAWGLLIASAFFCYAAEPISSARSVGFPIDVPVATPIHDVQQKTVSRLKDLERKAAERDLYLARTRELQKKIDLLTGKNDHVMMNDAASASSVSGQLSMLKEKATLAEQMARQVESIRRENTQLIQRRDALEKEVSRIQNELAKALTGAAATEQKNTDLERKNKGLKETVGRLLLGEFEYYEVKTGETLQSIAANPLVYGDAARAGWLRQANEGRVRDLNRLNDGDMLVIPRFPRTGAYEF